VVLAARRKDRLDGLAEQLRDPIVVPIDLAADGAAAELIELTLDTAGRVDILINNAGSSDDIPARDFPVERFREIVDINLIVPFALAQAAARSMPEGGSIVNIASQYGLVGVNAGIAAYTASKGGLVNLTRQLAVEWARSGVRVNAIAPGYFPTEMTEGIFDGGETEQWLRRISPMGRGGDEHELDGALLYLASDASSYVTGAVLSVDGGWTAV
jgi:NAD(P)-dependent dehydrogenase (short-subunit alcohol dehydrogenase family)